MRENEEQTYACSECGAVVDEGNLHTFDEHMLCDECYRETQESAIKPYNYKPEPTFYGSGDLFYFI